MPTRKYTAPRRAAQQAERLRRVARATAELHAERGVAATSYADIAQRAGVSLPTVYAYFPDQDTMMQACTGHVREGAPPFDTAAVLAAPELRSAVGRLVEQVDARHAHFAPWQSWRDDRTVPFLARAAQQEAQALKAFVRELLARHRDPVPEALPEVWESLLGFDLWERLTRRHGLARPRVREILNDLLLASLGPEPARVPSQGPRRPVP